MAANDSVFSIRLVISDFYMEKPVPGLDPVYSEFRGRDIKKVPIIRVFGSNAQGQKTCMHVHGVFPYFYIPYDQKDFESVNQAIYQIAINLDKAINISLSQGSSSVQHVFKVQLVKGIPFYGYHRSEHQYLKIYMFNPRFVRRAANLLQNGAIMNKNFHPHEAHVPYILQFMIDFNLYGMSFIHVPLEIVKFRRNDATEVIPYKNLKETQILDYKIAKKLSCSRLECDIGSNFILNRFQLVAKTSSTHTNPGIESIWHDEKLRRQKMAQSLADDEEKLNAIPALEVPSTQERPNVYPTESEIFYRTALVSKLWAMETSLMESTQVSDQTINCTLSSDISNMTANATLNASLAAKKQQKRTFNLSKMLQNAVYPEECSQDKNLVNASFVENHLSNNNAFQQSLSMDITRLEGKEYRKLSEDESIFLEDTIVDEELVLSLTQSQQQHVPHNATLREEDMELLDILEELEEDNNNDNKIDLDSSLAPLTQDNINFALSPEQLDQQTTASLMQKFSPHADSDEEHENDDNIHDFSIALDNLDDLILKLTQSATETSLISPLPQTDGSDDLPKTPTKVSAPTSTTKTPPRTPTTPRQRRLTLASPSRSPRTPKSGHKYKPLPLIITNRSTGKKIFTNPSEDITTACKNPMDEKANNLPLVSLRKKLAMTELRRKSISAENYTEENQNQNHISGIRESASVSKRRSKRYIDLDKTHITCNLTPRRTNDKILKVYNVDAETNAEDLKENESRKSISENINEKNGNTNRCEEKDTCKSIQNPEACDGFKTNPKTQNKDNVKENVKKSVSSSRTNDNDHINLQLLHNDSNEDSEEILDSEPETEYPSLKLTKTPNLKRLRRSFLATHSAKRRKIAKNEAVINSSKFESSNILSRSLNKDEQSEKITSSNEDKQINSSKFEKEILETKKDTQQEINPPLPKTNSKIGRKKVRLGLKTKDASKVSHSQSIQITEVLLESKIVVTYEEHHEQPEKITTSKESYLINSSKIENEKDTQQEINPTLPKTNSEIVSKKCSLRLRKLAKAASKANHLQSIETPKVLLETSNKEGVQNSENVLRKSKRLVSNEKQQHTVGKTKQTEIRSNIYRSQSSLQSEVNISSSGSTLKESTNEFSNSGTIKHMNKEPLKSKTNIPSKKCRVRLRKIGVADCKTMKDLGIMEIMEESEDGVKLTPEGNRNKPARKDLGVVVITEETETNLNYDSMTAKDLRILELTGESKESINLSGETKHNETELELRVTELPEESEKGVKTSTQTNNKRSPNLLASLEFSEESEENGKTMQKKSPSDIRSTSDGFKNVNSLEQTKPSMSHLHFSNTDNLLKSLLKLTSTETKEWRLTASPTLEESLNLPLAQTNGYATQSSSIEFITESPLPQSSDEEIAETPPQPANDNCEDNPKSSSLSEKSIRLQQHSPQLFTQNSSPSIMLQNKHLRNSELESSETSSKESCIVISSSNENASDYKNSSSPTLESRVVLTPLDLPPTRDEVLKGCIKLKLPEYEFQQPFYSNPDDVTKQKEIGFTILQISSNKLNDLEEFQSILGNDIKGLAAWRRNQLLSLGGPAMLTKYRNTQRIREYFATQKTVAITPQISAPTRQEVKVWLKARELLKAKGGLNEADEELKIHRLAEEDSPIKIRRQKITLMLNNDGGQGDGNDSDNSLDCSSRSLSLTPLTPTTPLVKEPVKEKINKSFTPVTTKIERIPLERFRPARKRNNNRRVLSRVSLNQKMREAMERRELERKEKSSQNIVERFQRPIEALDKDKHSQNSLEKSQGRSEAIDKEKSLQKEPIVVPLYKDKSSQNCLEKSQEHSTAIGTENSFQKNIENFKELEIIHLDKDKYSQISLEKSQGRSEDINRATSLQKNLITHKEFEVIPIDKNKFFKTSLKKSQELGESKDREKSFQKSLINCKDPEVKPASEENIVPHSQTSETSVSSQTALAEMERSSFMRQMEQLDVTMGCSNNNSTFNNTFGFKVALENLQQAKADIEFNFLTIITLEVFVATRDDLFPNPQIDEIRCLFYAIENSIPSDHIDNDNKLTRTACGYIMVHDSRDIMTKEGRIHGIDRDIDVTIVQTEVEALEALLGLCARWDADIYAGYEIEMSSWGFVIERAKYLCLNIAPLLSRVPTQKVRDFVDEDRDQFTDLDVEMKLCGRILLDVWRLMRSEIALTSYTFENVMYHIMHKRCPWHSYRTLTEWFSTPGSRWIVIEYYLERVRGTLRLLDQLDLIGRTSEMAKLIGIQFYEVLSRGSQFRVESMMLRIAKPKNLVPISPSVQQRAHMRAPEYLALILEPQSRFYADPVIVLDFQSLYPSMIIGYNYCFSTCLGRVEHLGQSTPFEFGAAQLRVSPSMLRKLVDRDLITISPCGVVFVKASVREGILPRMLTEILDTRQMVKQSMKIHKSNSALQRILHSRQLGLKLMANVTYGYTAANFSGRMPAVEVGDTVVAKGRETLERAIKMVEANEKWNVKVVYGDTDSMFVQVPGRNREEAFRIGEEIAEAVTKQNPHPVKLKLEKVYQPCILQTKKRYVGYMYETADQKEPVYEAKGIETVRRDGCPMVAKMLEKVLRILFESADVSQVKQYVCRQFTKLLSGRANLQDLIFAKEFRGMNGYKASACVPALELTRKWIQTDPRRIPRRGERVPFIITNGPPGVPLIRLIRHPHEVLADEGLKINAIYYITKAIIPPLNRCLLLLGADVNEWFTNLPRKILMTPALSIANEVIACPNNKSKKSTISQFFSTTNCIVDCGRQTKHGICDVCNCNATRSTIILQTKISKIERAYLSTQHICQACCGRVGDLKCGSLDCPVLYVMEVKRRDLQQIVHFRNLLEERF